ncbi:uncharacterized protein FOMMEDRAFT_31875 [Fomitiporia mediterranea MF3/22]|uniref:uncharacterized protein n=1 Tax=Fomitiporia mediterranea (strain MF3/22) TaxID=694068 RepID=UPI00044088C9|nr:uncharacterized protein FOMMEDRAFT_31875 [Fomitiporia mediterranea MF3/22]EJC98418.1 hypothetical protein FOMMEDRAFT_31875 [Fomitiporia mediterranea MF3/22]
MTPTPAATSLSLTVIRASQIKWVSSLVHSERPNLYVHIKFNNVKTRTRAVKLDLCPQWDETFSFDQPPAGGGTKFSIQVMHSSSWKDKCVGKIEVGLDDLLQRCADGKDCRYDVRGWSQRQCCKTSGSTEWNLVFGSYHRYTRLYNNN